MKLNKQTLDILKNFSTINPNLVVKQGSSISTISEAKNVISIAEVDDSFPQDFGVYDLSEFLSLYNLVGESPELEFSESSVQFSSGRSKATYRFADQSILTTPKSAVKMPNAELSVTITEENLAQVRRAASALAHSIVSVKGNDGVVSLSVTDPKNSSANSFDIVIDENNDCKGSFSLEFLIANLKVIGGDYAVNISSKLISHWSHANTKIQYFVALEKTSTWNI